MVTTPLGSVVTWLVIVEVIGIVTVPLITRVLVLAGMEELVCGTGIVVWLPELDVCGTVVWLPELDVCGTVVWLPELDGGTVV